MKKNILVLFVLLSSLLTGFKLKKDHIPSGMIAIDKTLFIDKTEVRNIDYMEYTHWIKQYKGENSVDYLKALPDTSQKIRVLFHGNNKIEEMKLVYYFWHPSHGNYPVVFITYEQAIDYCNWRADRINENIYLQSNKSLIVKELPANIPQIFKYRLPTKDEWIRIAKQGIDLRHGKKLDKRNIKYKIIEQIMVTGNFLETGQNIPENVDNGIHNKIGYYNLYGNVAEMSNIKGIALGGYYGEKLADYEFEKDYKYDSPRAWLGFRCVAEKIEN